MAKPQKIYERPLKKPVDGTVKAAITQFLSQYENAVPVEVSYAWDAKKPVLRVDTKLVSWTVVFAPERVVVFVHVSMAGRVLNTARNRQKVIDLLDTVVTQLDL